MTAGISKGDKEIKLVLCTRVKPSPDFAKHGKLKCVTCDSDELCSYFLPPNWKELLVEKRRDRVDLAVIFPW